MAKKILPMLPTLADVLYVPPSPDGARHTCGNCTFWASTDWRCDVHGPDVRVLSRDVCGYWIGGTPHPHMQRRAGIEYVEPRYSGLTLAPTGTSCDNCYFFDTKGAARGRGRCIGTSTANSHPVVDARGCCARWTPRGIFD